MMLILKQSLSLFSEPRGPGTDPVFLKRLQQQLLESSHLQGIEAIRSTRGNHSTALVVFRGAKSKRTPQRFI